MVKEAHSQGDVHSFSTIANTSLVYEATKTHKDGRVEVVNIVVPVKDNTAGEKLKNEEFAKAFKERQVKTGEKPFVYINNACESYMNTSSEVQAVGNKNFVNISTGSTAHSFWWHKSSTLYNVIDGVRNSKSFPEIKANMAESPKYKQGYDQYLLPNDPKYNELITKNMSVPLKFDAKIQKNGAEYRMTDQLNH